MSFFLSLVVKLGKWEKGPRLNLVGKQYIKAMRLFKDEPKWTPLNRSDELDANPHRKEYVTQFLN